MLLGQYETEHSLQEKLVMCTFTISRPVTCKEHDKYGLRRAILCFWIWFLEGKSDVGILMTKFAKSPRDTSEFPGWH